MYKLATAALAVALGISLSAIPAMSADDNKTLKDKAVDAKDTVKEKTSEAWDKTKEKTSEAWDKTKEETVEAKDKIKAKVSGDKKECAEGRGQGHRRRQGRPRRREDQGQGARDQGQDRRADREQRRHPSGPDGAEGEGPRSGPDRRHPRPAHVGGPSRLPEGLEHQGDRPARRRHQVAPDGPDLGRVHGDHAVGLAGRREALRGAVCGRLAVGGPGSTVEDPAALTRHRGARRVSAGPA